MVFTLVKRNKIRFKQLYIYVNITVCFKVVKGRAISADKAIMISAGKSVSVIQLSNGFESDAYTLSDASSRGAVRNIILLPSSHNCSQCKMLLYSHSFSLSLYFCLYLSISLCLYLYLSSSLTFSFSLSSPHFYFALYSSSLSEQV